MKVTVTSLSKVNAVVDRLRMAGEIPYVVSLVAPQANAYESFPSVPGAEDSLQIEMDDIRHDAEAPYSPTPDHAVALVNFVLLMRAHGGDLAHCVLHCMQGVSRSTAAALGAIYVDERLKHYTGEDELLLRVDPRVRAIREDRLEQVGRFAPNQLFLRHLDSHLQANGALVHLGGSMTMAYR